MPDLSILLFHPDTSHSTTNAALAAAARQRLGADVVDMQALYPQGAINIDREVARLLAARRLVLQFPVQWYATPPLMKTWQDAVLTRMFYLAYEREGRRLEGRPLMIAATAGNTAEAYRADGTNLFPLDDLMRPLQATAHRCRLAWAEPFLVYRAGKLSDAERAAEADRYVACLQAFIMANARGNTATSLAAA